MPLSGPWLHLSANAITAPFAANGGDEHNEEGSGGDAPLPRPFDYYPNEEVVNEDEGHEAGEDDDEEEAEMEDNEP